MDLMPERSWLWLWQACRSIIMSCARQHVQHICLSGWLLLQLPRAVLCPLSERLPDDDTSESSLDLVHLR